MKLPDLDTVKNSLWGIYFSTDSPESNAVIHLLIETGVGTHLVKNIGKNPSLIGICVKVIGNILTGDAQDIDEMISYGVFDTLAVYLNSSSLLIQKETIWGLSNIAAGTKKQISQLINSNIFPRLFEKLYSSSFNVEIAVECVWTICNCISGADMELAVKLLNMNVLQALIYVFENFEFDIILILALEGLRSFFFLGEPLREINGNNFILEKFCQYGGHHSLEKLQNHKSNELYLKLEQLVKEFFNTEEENEFIDETKEKK